MKYNYIEDCNYALWDTIVDRFDFFKRYPLSNFDLINLCGGVPDKNVEYLVLEATAQSKNAIKVEIETNLYDCSRTIDFKEMEIDNNGLYVNKPGNWVGTTLFLNQVKKAREFGFTIINVTAEGPDVHHTYTGHYKWGRVGFKMNKYELNEFHIWISRMRRDEYDLGELLLNQEGCRLWKPLGWTWTGKFLLEFKSDCMMYLEDYLEREGIDFKLYS